MLTPAPSTLQKKHSKSKSKTGFGAAYGTAKSGVGIASMGVMRPELVMKSIVPVVMAGVLGIYGLIIAVIISTGSEYLLYGWREGVRERKELFFFVFFCQRSRSRPFFCNSPPSSTFP